MKNMIIPEKAMAEIKEKFSLPDGRCEALQISFRPYEKGDVVRPSIVADALGMDMEKTYEVLMILKEHKVIDMVFQYLCLNCSSWQDGVYKTIGKVPADSVVCSKCGKHLDFAKDCMVIFQVNELDEGKRHGN